jgi:hypothetical protein
MLKKVLAAGIIIASLTTAYGSITRFRGYTFEAYALSDVGYRYCETGRSNGATIQVENDDEYSLVINNPLPVRVAVAVTIDGLNVIDGKRTTPGNGAKWMIGPYSSITLRGWQTGRSSLRRFVFTGKSASYAKWKEERDNREYTQNLGIIGIAYFWNSAELQAALRPPEPFANGHGECRSKQAARSSAAQAPAESRAALRCAEADAASGEPYEQAGTGMGSNEYNGVYDVEFRYDAGMYRANDALLIYYEFARKQQRPQPFVNERAGFAPEMP